MATKIPRKLLNWATSKTVGRISEIAVLAPLRRGCVPGERRTYEERLLSVVSNLDALHERGLPTVLGSIPAIHFGRIMIIRPEQYLLYSNVDGVDYYQENDHDSIINNSGRGGQIPEPIDDYEVDDEQRQQRKGKTPAPLDFRSFVLTLVEFDGDLKVYFRDIDVFLAQAFDSVFENCENYPTTQNFELFWLWIRRYQVNTDLFYAPYSNLSVVRIKQLEDFKRRFDAFVARVRTPLGPRVGSMDDLFDEFLRESQQYARDFPTPGGMYQTSSQRDGT